MPLRVWIEDVWDHVLLSVSPSWTVAEVKQEALRTAIGAECDPANYQVKFHGALILNENARLGELDVGDSASFTVLTARRRPVH
ncbi:MAG: hypothetical protein ACE5HT_08755 [Gemmatimonadales bacterium]